MIALPLEVRNETARLADRQRGLRRRGAACWTPAAPRRAVGLVSASNIESEQPLLSDVYYLERALAPYADLHKGTISASAGRSMSRVLVLADIGRDRRQRRRRGRASFVNDGGVLIRFAGERMTGGSDDLVPVKLRVGGRYLGGAMAWAEPQHLAPFPETSPFDGLAMSPTK